MINSLQIKNFQSHQDTKLELDPGVNVIVGPTDSGKTTIIRALRWLIFNRPQGSNFRSNWGGETEVTAEIDDSQIRRIKSKGDTYWYNTEEYKAFRTEVPEEIAKAFNMDEINIQHQMDAPFLLTQSPGEVAKHFNEIAHLDQIDNGLKNINRWIREHEGKITYEKDRVKELEESLTQFDFLPDFETKLRKLEQKGKKHSELEDNHAELSEQIRLIRTTETTVSEMKESIEVEKYIDPVLELMEKKEVAENKTDALGILIIKINNLKLDIVENKQIIAIEGEINIITGLMQQQEEIDNEITALQMFHNKILNMRRLLSEAKERYDILHERFEKECPDICPFCEQKIKK